MFISLPCHVFGYCALSIIEIFDLPLSPFSSKNSFGLVFDVFGGSSKIF